MMTFLRIALASSAIAMAVQDVRAADLLHRYHRRHHIARHTSSHRPAYIWAGDESCPADEPADYKPRITNFNEPSCYAARPYGLSSTLYDHSLDVKRGY